MALPQEKDPIRQNQLQPGSVRGPSSVNNDWQYLDDKENKALYGEAANDSYSSEPDTVDEAYSKTAFSENVLGPQGIGQINRKEAPANQDRYLDQTEPAPQPKRTGVSKTVARRLLAKALVPGEIVFKLKVTQTNLWASGVLTTIWLWVQLPFAILGIITMGVVYSIDSLTSGEGGILAWFTGKALAAAAVIAKTIGIDFGSIALQLMAGCTFIIMAFGIGSMLVLMIIYVMRGMNPLFGDGAGLKIGMFLLAIMGYSTPLANLFPFIFLYMAAVWFYPR